MARVLEQHPLTQGLAELLTYFQLARPGLDVLIDPDRTWELVYDRVGSDGCTAAIIPRVTFVRNDDGESAAEGEQP
ncbi:hypothetical protein ACH4A7_36390 [Streptomyces cyaneofuscatus]|uniref:hypothetical protein n=1 Tax=Streptomyces cyaneofuscatus TaxID=66883 RepID=UPI0037B10D95